MKDISLHLMDIIQNSITAKSTRIDTVIIADLQANMLEITISDNGVGMDKEFLRNVTNPFVTTRTTRKVGLGVPLFMDSAKRTGGYFTIESEKKIGTTLKAGFVIDNIDRLPLGDISETITGVIMTNPEIEFGLVLDNKTGQFRLSTSEVKEKLGGVPINHLDVIAWIREYIDEGIKTIFGGVLDEIVS